MAVGIDKNLSKIWYLAQLRPNGLRAAKLNLERQLFKVFCPMQEGISMGTKKPREAAQPLFPGYLFVNVDQDSQPWQLINSTYGVSKLVNLGTGGPNAVPQAFMLELIARCDETGILLPPENLTAGDTVKILYGPFANTVCAIERVDSDQRIWLLLDLMGRETRVGMPKTNVWKM